MIYYKIMMLLELYSSTIMLPLNFYPTEFSLSLEQLGGKGVALRVTKSGKILVLDCLL
jgi:hypothetical protein